MILKIKCIILNDFRDMRQCDKKDLDGIFRGDNEIIRTFFMSRCTMSFNSLVLPFGKEE